MSYTKSEENCLHKRLWTPPLEKLLRRWNRQILKRSHAHLDVSRIFNHRNYQLGIPTVILSTITATGGIATFENCDPNDPDSKCVVFEWLRLGFGILAICSGILASLHTFLNYQKRAEKHKTAANKYEAMHRSIDTLILAPPTMRGDPIVKLQTIKKKYDSIVERFPSLPSSYDIELTYKVEPGGIQPPGSTGIQPPSLSETDTLSERAGLSNSTVQELMKAMNTDTRPRQLLTPHGAAVSERVSVSERDEEVVIPFDLECERGLDTTIAALAAVRLAAQDRKIVEESLSRALEFEMERLNRSDDVASTHNSTLVENDEFEEIIIGD